MHTRKHGRAGSRKPTGREAPAWVTTSSDDTIAIVEKLAKEGKTEAEIGRVLRDEHGVPSARLVTGKTVSQILDSKKLRSPYPQDLLDLIQRATTLRKHLKQNKKDHLNQRILLNTESKIKRLVRYYRGKRLPAKWKYDPATAALLVK